MAGGIDWLRWHHGAVNDQKFQLVARRAGASVAEVIAVWACLLEAASQSTDRGHPGDLDHEAMDCALGLRDGASEAIHRNMRDRGLIDADGRLAAWDKRQPKREDGTAADRKRRQRDREKSAEIAPTVTQETDVSRNVTHGHDRGEERREELSPSLRSGEARKRATLPARPDDVDESTWRDWLALRKAKKAPVTETVLREAEREAAKAGLPLTRFLEIWCARGSQGLQADWLRPDERARAGPNSHPPTKSTQALHALEALKSHDPLAPDRNRDWPAEAAFALAGPHAGR